MPTNTCKHCGATFDHDRANVTICRGCWYSGRYFEEQHAALFGRLRALDGVARAEIDHTGGGCFGLGIQITAGRFLFGTEAYQDEAGDWSYDVGVPQPGQAWAFGVYSDDEDGFYGGEALTPPTFVMNDDELIAFVQRQIAETIGATFVELLRVELTEDEFRELQRRNATPDYKNTGSCASHDYLDANMVMLEACRTHGHDAMRHLDDPKLWNAAWEAAMPALTAAQEE